MKTVNRIINTPSMKVITLFLVYLLFFVCSSALLLFSVFRISIELVVENPIAIKLWLGALALVFTLIQIILCAIFIRLGLKLRQVVLEHKREFDR